MKVASNTSCPSQSVILLGYHIHDNPFDPIHLNCALDKEKNHIKGTLISLVTYIKHYKDDKKTPILLYFALDKYVAVNAIIGKPTLKIGEHIKILMKIYWYQST